MIRSDQIDKLVEALAKAQSELVEPLVRNKKVSVRTRAGGTYEFEYADLDAIIKHVRPALTKHGLWFTQTLTQDDQGRFRLETMLLHASGQYIGSLAPLFIEENSGNQGFGSALTFQKRYQLAAILGVAADTDDDANSADGNDASILPRKPKPAAAAVAAPPVKAPPTTPQELQVLQQQGGGSDWIAFGQEFIAAAQASKTPELADQWLALNQKHLEGMEKQAPKVYKRLVDSLAGVYPTGLKP